MWDFLRKFDLGVSFSVSAFCYPSNALLFSVMILEIHDWPDQPAFTIYSVFIWGFVFDLALVVVLSERLWCELSVGIK